MRGEKKRKKKKEKKKVRHPDSNRGPNARKAGALPTEPHNAILQKVSGL